MKKYLGLIVFVFLFLNVSAIEKTGEYNGDFDVNYGDAGIVIQNPEDVCIEDWSCSYFTECSGNTQIFMCRDCNSCGTYNLMPQSCGVSSSCGISQTSTSGGSSSSSSSGSGGSSTNSCIEDWNCSEWTDCSNEDTQTRECNDLNKCGTSQFKPLTSKICGLGLESGTEKISQEGVWSKITGAVIGGGRAKFTIPLIFILLIGGVYLGVSARNKKKGLK